MRLILKSSTEFGNVEIPNNKSSFGGVRRKLSKEEKPSLETLCNPILSPKYSPKKKSLLWRVFRGQYGVAQSRTRLKQLSSSKIRGSRDSKYRQLLQGVCPEKD